jgi:hypothetical protein
VGRGLELVAFQVASSTAATLRVFRRFTVSWIGAFLLSVDSREA